MTTINNEVQKPDDATLIVKRMLNAPPERAFRAWTCLLYTSCWGVRYRYQHHSCS